MTPKPVVLVSEERIAEIQQRWDGLDWSLHGNAVRGVQAVKDIHWLLSALSTLTREQEKAEQDIGGMHRVLSDAYSVISPEKHPNLSADIFLYLEDCERAACTEWNRMGDALEKAEQENVALRAQLEWEVGLKKALLPYQERAVTAESRMARVEQALKDGYLTGWREGWEAGKNSSDVAPHIHDAIESWESKRAALAPEEAPRQQKEGNDQGLLGSSADANAASLKPRRED